MIACVNLANLLLGSGLGLLLAWWGLDALTSLAPSRIPGLGDVAINGWVLAFTLGAGVLTGVATGLVPSLLASREGAALALRTGGQGLAGARGPQRLRGALVSMEVALSLILLPSRPGRRDAVVFLAHGHSRVFPDAGAPHREGTGRSRP